MARLAARFSRDRSANGGSKLPLWMRTAPPWVRRSSPSVSSWARSRRIVISETENRVLRSAMVSFPRAFSRPRMLWWRCSACIRFSVLSAVRGRCIGEPQAVTFSTSGSSPAVAIQSRRPGRRLRPNRMATPARMYAAAITGASATGMAGSGTMLL